MCCLLIQAANPGCLLEDFVRWYSPRDWIEEEDCPTSDTTAAVQQSASEDSKDNTCAEREADEGSAQGTSVVADVSEGDAEMEVGETAAVGGDDGPGDGDGDGWENEGWGEEDWDMINDDGELESKQDVPSQRIETVSEPPAIKVKCALLISCYKFMITQAALCSRNFVFSMFKVA